jgi:uncharacterized membrane protein YwaF
VLPTVLGLASYWYLIAAILGGAWFLWRAGGFLRPTGRDLAARHLFLASIAYLPLVLGWRADRPWWKGPLTALLWGNAYLLLSLVVNLGLGTNFGFTARKPVNPSLLDHLGPWPFYLLGMQVLGALLFSLLALPVLRRDRTR